MRPDIVLFDLRTCDLTVRQVMGQIRTYKKLMPGMEIFMDGDSYAIVARPLEAVQ